MPISPKKKVNQIRPKRWKIKMRSKDKKNLKSKPQPGSPPYHIVHKTRPKAPSNPYKPQPGPFTRSNSTLK